MHRADTVLSCAVPLELPQNAVSFNGKVVLICLTNEFLSQHEIGNEIQIHISCVTVVYGGLRTGILSAVCCECSVQ